MVIDMSQFHQVFFEESAEHLAEMETLLLELDLANPEDEQLNAIFRAAHSIKGSAGTFGFSDLAEVTHELETLLDRIRRHELPPTAIMVDAFLAAGDLLKSLLAAHQGQGEPDAEAIAGMCQRLQALAAPGQGSGGGNPAVSANSNGEPKGEGAKLGAEPGPVSGIPAAGFDIQFVPTVTAAETPGVLDNLGESLAEIGRLTVLSAPPAGQVGLWHLTLHTGRSWDQVLEVLDFVAEPDALRVKALAEAEGASAEAAGDDGFGLFAPVSAAPVLDDEDYGFFTDAPGLPPELTEEGARGQTTGAVEGEDYGFFEPLPGAGEAPGPVLEDGDGYGFFVPIASPAPDVPEEGDGYGFFVPLSVLAEAAQIEPVVAPGEGESAPALPVDPARSSSSLEGGGHPADAGGGGMAKAPDGAGLAGAAQTDGAHGAQGAAPPPARPGAGATGAGATGAGAAGAAGAAAARGANTESSIRVSVEKVDQLINLVGELVITQAMLLATAQQMQESAPERLVNGLAQLERNSRDLQEAVMSIRMLPISFVFSRFPRVIRDLSAKLGKQVELKTSGEHTELDKGLIERITDPLTHLIRNSLDHGIESPEQRRSAGKPVVGTITLKAAHQGGNIVIEVGDDGAGLNRQKILAKARERGLQVSDQMSDQEVWQLIFEAGFSTAEKVTDVSGRGVGMDVVRRNIQELGGRIEIESMTGIGTRMTVRLPLTLAILDGMSIGVGEETFILPLSYVVESLQPRAGDIKTLSNQARVILVRGEYLPVLSLARLFQSEATAQDFTQGIMVILDSDGQKAALFVDALLGQHQVVIKSLEQNYRRVEGLSGATIMGDGRVALILDVSALVWKARTVLLSGDPGSVGHAPANPILS